MRHFLFFLLALPMATISNAQISNPVKWNFSAVKVADKTFEIHATAALEPKWHIYSQNAGEGPEPTSFQFVKNPLLKLEGKVKEAGELLETYDPNFNSKLRFYANSVDFVQVVKMKSSASTVLKGTVTYMVCDDKKCLPPKDVPFSVKISGK
jgi:thiol:disulfide interchange protein DsbD